MTKEEAEKKAAAANGSLGHCPLMGKQCTTACVCYVRAYAWLRHYTMENDWIVTEARCSAYSLVGPAE